MKKFTYYSLCISLVLLFFAAVLFFVAPFVGLDLFATLTGFIFVVMGTFPILLYCSSCESVDYFQMLADDRLY